MDAQIIFELNDTELLFNDSNAIEANFSFFNASMPAVEFRESAPYYGEYLKAFHDEYIAIHRYLSFVICVFGITANILNIIVLTRKTMVSSTNAILTGLAVADMLLMFSYIPYAYITYNIGIGDKKITSETLAVFNIFLTHVNVINHTISTWLTVTVAIWRYIAISFPFQSASLCSMTRAKYAITATYITCIIFYLPNYFQLTISKMNGTNNEINIEVNFSISQRQDRLLEKIGFWLFSIFTKFLPCVALTALSLGLILVLNKAKKRRQTLKKRIECNNSHHKTTKMLLALVLLFLLTQLPVGLITLLIANLGEKFFDNVFLNFREAIDTLVLINCATNFVIYCRMCRKFRETFTYLFIPKCIKKQEVGPIAVHPKTVTTINV